jgi:hypothetical protein
MLHILLSGFRGRLSIQKWGRRDCGSPQSEIRKKPEIRVEEASWEWQAFFAGSFRQKKAKTVKFW